MKRRGIIAALLAPLAAAQTKESDFKIRVVEPTTMTLSLSLNLQDNKPDTPCLMVSALGRTVTVTTQEVMDALEAKP